jgi:transcriptional regulator with XRE-family HTH domain
MPLRSTDKRGPVNRRFGENLRRIRRDRGLSQEALADLAGVHRTEASLLERAGREPRLSTLVKLAGALEAPAEELVKGITWQLPEKAESSVGSCKT